jgi:hypothetical protein
MKKLLILAIAISIAAFQGCEGPMGPQGPQGQDGGVIASSAFELGNVDFNVGNNYEVREAYGFEIMPFDVVLVYILWETEGGKDVWRLLPQSVFFDEGALQYNFDFTDQNVRIFLDGEIDLASLDASWLEDQVFRIVVAPADNVGRLDYSDYGAVTKMLGLGDEDFQKR